MPLAGLKLSEIYEYGMGVDEDKDKAIFWAENALVDSEEDFTFEGLVSNNVLLKTQKIKLKF